MEMTTTADARRNFWKGALAALGAAFTFGLSTPFAKLLLGEVSPFLMAGRPHFPSTLIRIRAVPGSGSNFRNSREEFRCVLMHSCQPQLMLDKGRYRALTGAV